MKVEIDALEVVEKTVDDHGQICGLSRFKGKRVKIVVLDQ